MEYSLKDQTKTSSGQFIYRSSIKFSSKNGPGIDMEDQMIKPFTAYLTKSYSEF